MIPHPKYSVGDTFKLNGSGALGSNWTRTIEEVLPASNGVWYRISFEELNPGKYTEILSEDYMDQAYVPYNPFFEEKKKYVSVVNGFEKTWTCSHVFEAYGKKYAVMFNEDFSFEEPFLMNRQEFKDYREIE